MVALGICCNKFLMVSYGVSFTILVFLLVLLLVLNWKIKKNWKTIPFYGISVYVIAFVLGMFLQNIHFQPQKATHYSHFIKEENVAKGIVVSNLKASKKNTKHTIKITELNQQKASGTILAYIEKDSLQNIEPGTEILFSGNFLNPFGEQNPYQFNYAKYLENNNIFDQVFLKSKEYVVVNHQRNWDYFWYNFQKKLADSFEIQNWNTETKAIINALLLGQRKLIDEETLSAYSDVGVVHILAISGLHVGIVYLMLLWILKPLQKNQRFRILQFFIILLVLWSFAFVTGFSASVSRSVLMFSLFAFGKLLNKNSSTFNIIGASAFVLFLYNPNLVFDIGFQMSYAAVISIVAFNPFFKYLRFSKNKIVVFFTDILAMSLAAQIGVLPISLLYFHQFSPLFLVANLVAIPLTTLILWTGIFTLLFNFIFEPIALVLGKLTSFLVYIMNISIQWFSHFKQLIIKDIAFNLILCIASYLLVDGCFLMLKKKNSTSLIYFLICVLILQLSYIGTKFYYFNKNECIVYASKESLLSVKKNDSILGITNFKTAENLKSLQQYKTGTFSRKITVVSLQNIYSYKKKKILIIDSFCVYPKDIKVDYLILTENTKPNLDRLIIDLQPKVVIANNGIPFYKIQQWKATCKKRKIPFHATAEKGYFRIYE